jgi:NTE family protein
VSDLRPRADVPAEATEAAGMGVNPARRAWLQHWAQAGAAASATALAWPSAGQAAPPQAAAGASPPTRAGRRNQRLVVVLGAGSARGFAHIGVIKALDAAGIRPDAIVGCSAGALVGAFWAAGATGSKMEQLAHQVRDEDVIDLVAGSSTTRAGIVSGQALQTFVNEGVGGRSIERLAIPLHIVATRFPSGEQHTFREGDTGFAVRASCSIPGIFIPAVDRGQTFLDGGLVSPLPTLTARATGADVVIAVDVGAPETAVSTLGSSGTYKLLLRSFEIMGESLRRHEASVADIVIRPDVGRIASTDFSARKALIEAGYVAAQRLLPVIQEKLRGRG